MERGQSSSLNFSASQVLELTKFVSSKYFRSYSNQTFQDASGVVRMMFPCQIFKKLSTFSERAQTFVDIL